MIDYFEGADRPQGVLALLFIGDIVGKPGRELLRRGLAPLRDRYNLDLVIANGENAAAGRGITREIGDALLGWGVDVLTSGNHIWAQRETADYIGAESRLLRPANFPPGVPGNGSYLARTAGGRPVGVINVMGRVFMQDIDDPFRRVLDEIEQLRGRTRVIFVDFHAEATSEKVAMGWHLDGKVTAVVGTHTHVQSADDQILPGGTAYLTDAGMTGPHDGVIGVEKTVVIDKFLRGMPVRMETATGNPRLNGILIAAEESTGKALAARRLSLSARELDELSFDLPFDDDPETGEPARDDPSARERRRVVHTVTELTAGIRDLLETAYLDVWVEGEISNCRLWNTGHLYFTLKDPAAQLKAVMFKSSVRSLKFKPEDGLHVIARGRLSVYDPKGEYQLVCEQIEPHGLGALQLAFDQLKRRLQAEGVFDPGRKRPLPALPRKIGIVTSLDGAAIRDIIKVLARRYPNAHLVIRPTRVQGEGAATDVARGLRAIVKVPGIDVIIVGRGGGSVEDLWAFNEESVARAIVASPVPVISAVGHESDVTIADFAADVRAPTPSAAAEMVVARKEDFGAHIERLGERVTGSIRGLLARMESRVHQLNRRGAFAGYGARLAMRGRHCTEATHALRHAARAGVSRKARRYQALRLQLDQYDLRRRLGAIKARLVGADASLRTAGVERTHLAGSRLQNCAARLDSLSPLAVLGRGYAVCWNDSRTKAIRDAGEVEAGQRVRVTLSRGELVCDVNSTSE